MNSRAWIENNLDNLEFNINLVRSKINKQTEIIAVVKANAYGHGDTIIAKKLNDIGITNFAVATIDEGINLRKNDIKGNILVLGYTVEERYKEIIENDLIQTLVDEQYAKALDAINDTNIKIKTQIKINTGMNRIGIKPQDINKIEEIYKLNKLTITGMFSHLAVSDEIEEESKEYTEKQIEQFIKCTNILKKNGYDVGKLHIQNSYGAICYPKYTFDYVRLGIFMYGIKDYKNDTLKNMQTFKIDKDKSQNLNSRSNEITLPLKEVLTLKSKIESVHKITKGETVGYGRLYKAKEDETIAAVSIGYADGYARSLANQGTKVIVNKEYATIVGMICMDQLMIKIPNNVEVKAGDTVILIGKDKDKQITVAELAKKANTISYEIVSRLSNRLDRIGK